MGLAPGCQLAEVGAAALGGHRAALTPQDGGCGQLVLRDQIVGEGQGSAEDFSAAGGAILWQVGRGQRQVNFGEQFFEGGKLGSVGCHALTIRLAGAESKRSLFAFQRTFQTLPEVP